MSMQRTAAPPQRTRPAATLNALDAMQAARLNALAATVYARRAAEFAASRRALDRAA